MTDYDLGLIGIMAILLGLILTGMGIGLLIPDLASRIRNWLRPRITHPDK